MDARRQRFVTGLLLVAGVLGVNAFADYRLILANPDELELIARQSLAAIFPDYRPEMGRPEFRLTERRAVLHDVVFFEKGGTGRELFRVDAIEAEFSLVPPVLSRLIVTRPTGTIRIDAEGNFNFDTGSTVTGGGKPTLLGDLHVTVRDGAVRVRNQFDGQDSDMLLRDLEADVDITPDLVAKGQGRARFGALFPLGHPFVGQRGFQPVRPVTDPDLLWAPIFPRIEFDLDRTADGRLRAEVSLPKVDISPQLKSVIPPAFQTRIWEELDPAGLVDVRARVALAAEGGLRLAVTIVPDPVRSPQIRPKGFPTDIDRIAKGRFEVNVFLPKDAPRPSLINVSWEGVEGRVGEGIVRSRGSVFPGGPGESVSLFLAIEAEGLALDRALQNALPPDIRKVYDQFSPQGRVRHANVTIFKGPHEHEPQLSVHVGELAGEISASFADYPIRLQETRGSFDIREGANVRVRSRGTFQHGGTATVAADVLAGDLIHVDVRASGVPIGPELVAGLSPRVREMVELFHPEGGTADVHVSVTKAHEDALAQPVVDVVLRDLRTTPGPFPFPLLASGRLHIVPRFPEGARPADNPDPVRVEVDLDITASGPGLTGAVAKGQLVIDPNGGPFRSDLRASVASLNLGPALEAALPPELKDIWTQLAPSGTVRDAEVRIQGIDRFEARGRGDGDLAVRPARFPWRLGVDAFEVQREGREVRILSAMGTTTAGTQVAVDRGRWTARGVVVDMGPGREPILDLTATARDARLGPELVRALPEGPPRDLLATMNPEGRFDASITIRALPGCSPRVEGDLDLRGARLEIDGLDETLAGLKGEPVTELAGRVHLEVPERVEVQGLRGRLAGALVAVAGRIVAPPEGAAATLARGAVAQGGLTAALASRADPSATTDLTIHVGGFVLDERTRAFAGSAAKDVIEEFRPSGPLDLQARVRRPPLGKARVDLRIRPRGMKAVPDLLPLQLEDIQGEVVVEDGEPVLVDIAGLLGDPTTIERGQPGPARVVVRRDKRKEAAFPGGGSRGRAFELEVTGFERPTDPRVRARLERELPAEKLALLTTFAPEGPIDAHAFIYQPSDERLPLRWVAELRPGPPRADGPRRGFSMRAGLQFEGIQGVVRLQGTVPELARGSCEGEVDLEQVEFRKQTARNMRGRFWLEDGVFSFGRRGNPVQGEVWGGKLRVVAEYAIQEDSYAGWIAFEEARLDRTIEELRELQTPEERRKGGGGGGGPVVGRVNGQLTFGGGGVGLDLKEKPFRGEAWLRVEDTNLLPVYGLGWTGTIADAFAGRYSRPPVFDRMYVEAKLRPEVLNRPGVTLKAVELMDTTSGLTLKNVGGTLTYDGDVSMQLAPFDTGWFQDILQNVPLIGGFQVFGKIWDPNVIPQLIPFNLVQDAVKNALGGREED